MRRRFWLVVLAAPLALVVSGVASATSIVVNNFPWVNTPSNYGGGSPVHGACNLTEVLDVPGNPAHALSGNNRAWGFSLACQAAVKSSTGSALGAGGYDQPRLSLPGAVAGGLGCSADAAGYQNSFCYGVGYNILLDRNPADCPVIMGNDASWSSLGASCHDRASFWAQEGCTWDMANSQQCDYYPGLHAAIGITCRTDTFTLGTTAYNVSGVDYFPLQFRWDCILESPNGSSPWILPGGTGISSCLNASNGYVNWADAGSGVIQMSERSTCVGSGGNPEAPMPDSFYVGGFPTDQGALTGCGTAVITPGGAGGLAAQSGHEYVWNVKYTGASVVSIIMNPQPANGSTLPGGALAADGVSVGATGSPMRIPWTPASTRTVFPSFYCIDGAGNYTFWGGPGSVGDTGSCADGSLTNCTPTGPGGAGSSCTPVGDVGCAVNLSDCLDGSGLGLNPSSWVPGLVSDLGCLLSWAFIPQSVNTASLSTPFTGHFPGTWVVDAVSSLNTLVSGLTTAAAASACDAPHIGSGPMTVGLWHTGGLNYSFPAPASAGCTTAVDATTGGELFGYRGIIRDVLRLLVWFGALAFIWRIMPWHRGKSDDIPGLGPSDGEFVSKNGQEAYTYEV